MAPNNLSPHLLEAIREEAYKAQPTLTALNVEVALVPAVCRLLNRYDGPKDDEEALTQWAISTIVLPGAELLVTLATLQGKCRDSVRKGIWSVVKNCRDLGALTPADTRGIVAEIESSTWFRVIANLDEWLTPGYSKTPGRSPAKLRTRLRSFAREQARGWRTERLRHRDKFRTLNHAIATEEQKAEAPTARKPSLNEIEQRAA